MEGMVDFIWLDIDASGWYSVWLRAGRPGDRGSIPGSGKIIFPVASVSRSALGPTQHPIQ
jgi:hypothetical protein